MEKNATAEKKLTRLYIEAWPVITLLAIKDIMIKRHMDIADLSESPMFVHQSRKHKEWVLISIYICKVWSMKYFPDYFAKMKNNAANKTHLSHLNASMAKNEMTYS